MGDTNGPKSTQLMHAGMLLRCFLCHEMLPEPDWNTKGTYPEWKGHLVSVFPFFAPDGSIRQQLRSTHLQKTKLRHPNKIRFWSSNALTKELSIEPCGRQTLCGDYCPKCRPDSMVYLSHRDCWKVAFSSFHLSPPDWSRLATQTRPFEIRRYDNDNFVGCHDYPGRIILPSMPPHTDLLCRGTPLGGLLSKICLLPAELQFQIMGLSKGTMLASLLQTKQYVSELLPLLHDRSSWTLLPKTKPLRVGRETSKVSLYCHTTDIMGQPYLSNLALEPLKGHTAHIDIASTAVRGLQFALGWFGLRGIRISYEDGSFSPWVGDSTSCWVGIVRCSDLSELNVVSNEWQIICIDTGSRIAPDRKTPAMWYGDCPPAGISTRLLTPLSSEVLHHYPNWKQCQYLPLSSGEEYASGLTVYMSCGLTRIYGIVSHGATDSAFGETEYEQDSCEETCHGLGVPIHFPLRQGEYLTSAWLHTTSRPYELDGLLALGTNFSRTQYFGAYQLPDQIDIFNGVEDSAWVNLSMGRPAKIHGLAFDVPRYTCDWKTIYGFGVCQDASFLPDSDEADKPPPLPIHAMGPTLPSPNFTAYLRQNKTRYDLSTASLNDVSAIHVRKKMIEFPTGWICRYVGLQIIHIDSGVEILGQWDPRDKKSISRLYDSREGLLKTLVFHLASIQCDTYVESITSGVTDSPWDHEPLDSSLVVPMDPPSHSWDSKVREDPTMTRIFDCFQENQRIAWWFTSDFDDIGRDHGIPEMQLEADTNLVLGEEYDLIEIE